MKPQRELFNYILKYLEVFLNNSDEWNMDANIYLCSDYYSGAILATSAHSCLCTGLAFYSTGYTSLPLGLQYQCSLQGPDALQQPSPSLHLRREMEASAQTSVDSSQQTGEMNFHDDSKSTSRWDELSWRQQVSAITEFVLLRVFKHK